MKIKPTCFLREIKVYDKIILIGFLNIYNFKHNSCTHKNNSHVLHSATVMFQEVSSAVSDSSKYVHKVSCPNTCIQL